MMPDSDSPDVDFKLPDGTQFKGNLQDAMSSLPNSMQPDLQRIGADIAQRNPVERNPAAPGNDPIVNKMQDYYAGIEKDRARQQGMLDQDRLQNQEQRHAVTEDMKRQMAEGPQRVAQPTVPKPKPEEITPVFGALMVMAALSGMGARNHATGALNAMNGVMEGAHTGNQELYQRSMKEFEEKSKQAIAAQKQMTDEWDRKIKINEMSREDLDNEARLFALKYPQLKLDEAIQRGEAGHMFQVMESARTATTKAEEQTRKFTDQHGPQSTATGEEFLSQLNPSDAATVKAVSEGRQSLSEVGYKDRTRIGEMVNQYNPDWNSQQYKTVLDVKKDFTKGKSADNITAINTAIGHLGTLSELNAAINNNDVKSINRLTNAIGNQLDNPNINNQQMAAAAVGDEMMRVFRGVGASQTEADAWKQKFDDAHGPEQQAGAIKTGVHLLKSRLDALNDRWNRGTGEQNGFPGIVSEKSKRVLESFGVEDFGGDSSSNSPVGTNPFKDTEKERRYQEWKKNHAGQ